MGIKIQPHDIFLDDDLTKKVEIDKIRIALNKLPFKIFWSFVTSPVNIDEYKARLYNLRFQVDSNKIQNMLLDDYNKAEQFEERNNELEFMMFKNDINPI